MPRFNDVNEAFAAYKAAIDTIRPELENSLIKSLEEYGRKIVWLELHEEHPEIVNHAVAIILARLDDFKGNSKFGTWVYTIVKRLCFAELRRKITDRRTLVSLGDHQADDSATYELDGDAKFILDRLRKTLSEDENALIDLKLKNYTYSEIAEMLGTTPPAIESRWRRLCQKLRQTRTNRESTHRTTQKD